MSKNCEKVKFLKKQSELNRRKRIQRWMNELRKMTEDDYSTNSSNVKLDKIDLLEYAIKQLQFYNGSFQMGFENCQAEIVTCLSRTNQSSENQNTITNLSSIIVNKLNKTCWPNIKVLHDLNSGDGVGQKRDVLVKLRQKIIENKRKKCIKQKMNIYSDGGGGGTVDNDVWRPW